MLVLCLGRGTGATLHPSMAWPWDPGLLFLCLYVYSKTGPLKKTMRTPGTRNWEKRASLRARGRGGQGAPVLLATPPLTKKGRFSWEMEENAWSARAARGTTLSAARGANADTASRRTLVHFWAGPLILRPPTISAATQRETRKTGSLSLTEGGFSNINLSLSATTPEVGSGQRSLSSPISQMSWEVTQWGSPKVRETP